MKTSIRNFLWRQGSPDFDQSKVKQVYSKVVPPSGTAWLAGGSIRRLIVNDDTETDYDFFFPHNAAYLNVWTFMRAQFPECKQINNDFNSTFFIEQEDFSAKVQLIRIFGDTPEETLANFDFTICQFLWDGENYLYTGDMSLWDLSRKRLAINRITYPVASLRRLIKYSKQGFYACQGCLLQLLQEAGESDLENLEVQYVD